MVPILGSLPFPILPYVGEVKEAALRRVDMRLDPVADDRCVFPILSNLREFVSNKTAGVHGPE
jgi:hypothetical protein